MLESDKMTQAFILIVTFESIVEAFGVCDKIKLLPEMLTDGRPASSVTPQNINEVPFNRNVFLRNIQKNKIYW
jgi:hypothetical protein